MLQNKLKYFCELQINKQRCESTYDYLSADVICSDKRKGYQEISVLYGPANGPGPRMIPVPQMIPKLYRKWSRDRNWFHRKKLGMAWTPWKVYGWIHIFLIILREEKTSTSGIKAAIKNVSHTAQNTKSFRKRTAKGNMNLRRCLCHLNNRLELFPVHFLYLRPR